MNEEQIRAIVDERIMKILGDYTTIPLDVEKAFSLRLRGISLGASAKAVSTETESIDDNLGVHSASALMDGFVQTTHPSSGTIYLPYYT